MKLNVAGSCRGNMGNYGGDGLIQDDTGKVHGASSILFGHDTNNEAKLRALKECVGLCKELGFS